MHYFLPESLYRLEIDKANAGLMKCAILGLLSYEFYAHLLANFGERMRTACKQFSFLFPLARHALFA